jgi:HK97 family phage prohead protease
MEKLKSSIGKFPIVERFSQQDQRRVLFTADARFAVTPATADAPALLTGYAMIWGATSLDRGGFKVRLQRGAPTFGAPTNSYFEHDVRLPIGTTDNGTLSIEQDDIGVKVTIKLPDTQTGRDTFTLVRDKYVRGMSFAMVKSPWAIQGYTAAGPLIVPVPGKSRVLNENGDTIVEVFRAGFEVDEITVTSRPAFTETQIGIAPPQQMPPTYSNRAAQALRLQRFKLDQFRPTGQGFARVANPTR